MKPNCILTAHRQMINKVEQFFVFGRLTALTETDSLKTFWWLVRKKKPRSGMSQGYVFIHL